MSISANTEKAPLAAEVPREFHRRMAAIIEAVQSGIWDAGVHDLLGYATDYSISGINGQQTLVLKRRHRSAYVRLAWDAIMSEAPADRRRVNDAIASAVHELM